MNVTSPSLLTVDNPVFSGFVFWSMILALKMIIMFFLTVRQRFKKKIFISPEDTVLSSGGIVKYDDPDIERVRRAHRNDLENILPFYIIGLFFVLSDPNQEVALYLFRIFAASRIIHTFVYAAFVVRQPVRAIVFIIGFIINITLIILTLLKFHHI